VVGNGDGGKPLGSGLGIFGMRSGVGLMRWTGVALMQGGVVMVDRERDKDGPAGRDSVWGGVSRAEMRRWPHDQEANERARLRGQGERGWLCLYKERVGLLLSRLIATQSA
jgi:hypothetical protein